MTIGHSHQQLIQKAFQNRQFQPRIANVQIFFQVLVEEFEDESEFSFGVYHIVKSYDVGMLELLETAREEGPTALDQIQGRNFESPHENVRNSKVPPGRKPCHGQTPRGPFYDEKVQTPPLRTHRLISLMAVLGIPSSSASNRIFFSAMISPDTRSLAL